MLIDIELSQDKLDKCNKEVKERHPDLDMSDWITDINNVYQKVKDGIYLTGLNFEYDLELFSDNKVTEKFYSFSPKTLEEYRDYEGDIRDNYGICDTHKQVLEKYPELELSEKKFVVSLCSIKKSEQPSSDGWRWHKWGRYIGNQKPQCEYLYDEDKIEEVFVYHIYEIA